MSQATLAAVLAELKPLTDRKKRAVQELMEHSQSSGSDSFETGDYIFTVVKKRKAVPFNEELVKRSMKSYNRKSETPIDDDFLKHMKDYRKSLQAKNPEVPRLSIKHAKKDE
jgi:hypothetical protein